MNKQQKIFLLLATMFVALLVVSNVIAAKTVSIAGLVGPAAVICYSLTFAITDTLSEIWGRNATRYVVHLGLGAVVLSAIFIKLAIVMPGSPFWDKQEAYELILGSNFRIVVASLAAYIVSQSHDVWAFHYLKEKTGGRHLWLRNNASSMVSQLLDTVIFIIIGFWGTGAPMWQMIVGQYVLKLIIAAVDTPIVYALVHYIRREVGDQNEASLAAAK